MEIIVPNQSILKRHLEDNEKEYITQLRADMDYLSMMLGINLEEMLEENNDEQNV